MKFTFMDLLLKKVIEMTEVKRKAHPRDKYIRTYSYIIAGKNFIKYKPKKHELIYLSPFLKSQSIQILFKHFIKMGYEYSNGSFNYKKLIRSNQEISQYFKNSFFLNLFRLNRVTGKGRALKNEISNYLKEVDKTIVDLLHNDKKKGLDLILGLGGNVFLLKNLDFEHLKKIDKELLKQYKISHNENYDSDWWLYFDSFEDGYMFDSYFDSFDTTLDSFDSEFDASSCSSCDSSGCNSCGGCD